MNNSKKMELNSLFCHFLKLVSFQGHSVSKPGYVYEQQWFSSSEDTRTSCPVISGYPCLPHEHLHISQIEHITLKNISRKKTAILITAIKLQMTLNCCSEIDDNTLISPICAGRSKWLTGLYWLKPLLKKASVDILLQCMCYKPKLYLTNLI